VSAFLFDSAIKYLYLPIYFLLIRLLTLLKVIQTHLGLLNNIILKDQRHASQQTWQIAETEEGEKGKRTKPKGEMRPPEIRARINI
jgi:hypothetical protein